jgi:RNA polymerase-interacting CarD/CdnL/TRCF family regulator
MLHENNNFRLNFCPGFPGQAPSCQDQHPAQVPVRWPLKTASDSCKILIRLNKNSPFKRIGISHRWRRHITINQGDSVYHPRHGIGKVESICKRSFSGEEETTFANLYFKRDKLTLMLRKQDLDETVRYPINAKEAKRLLDHLESWKGRMSKQWKARANKNQAVIESGDPFGYAEVYKGLRASDRVHLNHSLECLVDELAAALKKTPDQARSLISKRCGLAEASA